MNNQKRAILLVNLGSPDSSKVSDVRAYLKEFLSDPCVIALPAVFRYLLVFGMIAPLRSFRSAKRYQLLRTDRGFPLIYHSRDLEQQIRQELQPGTDLFLAMRFGQPSLKKALHDIKHRDYAEMLVLPLYPQYASSTTGSVISVLRSVLKGDPLANRTRIIPHFHVESDFTDLWKNKISVFQPGSYDAVVFSYHGIPVKQTQLAHPGKSCESLKCEHHYGPSNRYCYRAACFDTSRSISKSLHIEQEKVHTSFQSRFGHNWLMPFTDQILVHLTKEGKKKVLMISPSFVADCLETVVEIGIEYKKILMSEGGTLTLVPSLNSDPDWAAFVKKLVGITHPSNSTSTGLPLNHPALR